MATASFDPFNFLMKISPDLLIQYAKRKEIEFKTTTEEAGEKLAKECMDAIEKEPEEKKNSFWLDIWEIDEMGADRGSDYLVNRAIDKGFDITEEKFQQLKNAKERSMYFYLNFYELFAECLDDFSIDNMQGWRAEKTVAKSYDEIIKHLTDFEQGLRSIYRKEHKGKNVKVKHFERKGRVVFIGFIEDFLTNDIIFKSGNLNNKIPRKPVFMVYFLYYPTSGVLEVKAKGGIKKIKDLKKAFIEHMLKEDPIIKNDVRYDFERIADIKSLNFPIEAHDLIDQVTLKGLKLIHNSTNTNVSINVGNITGIGTTPMIESLNIMDVDPSDYRVTQFRLEVIFKKPLKGRAPRVTTSISYPNICDLKERDIDQKVRELLKRWKLDKF